MAGALTRRAFVAGSVALMGAGPLVALAPIAGASADFALGVQSFTLRRHALAPMLDVLVALGVRDVELIPELEILFYRLGSHFPVTVDAREIADVAGAIRSRGLRISASGVHSVPDEEAAARLFAFAEAAEIPLLTISPDDEALPALDRLCAAHPQIRLGLHNHGPFSRHSTIAQVESTLAGRRPNFGACVDTGHFIRSGEDPIEALRRLGPRVHGVHLKDHLASGFFARGCRLGDGELDLEGCFRALRDIGFTSRGAISIEFEQGGDAVVDDLAEDLRRARAAARLHDAVAGG